MTKLNPNAIPCVPKLVTEEEKDMFTERRRTREWIRISRRKYFRGRVWIESSI